MPKSKLISCALIAVAVSLTSCKDSPKDTHPQQLVSKRQAIFKDFTRTLEPMGLVARGRNPYNPREFNQSALDLQRLSTLPWAYFTVDGNYPPTRAKPDVWQRPADFKKSQDQYLAAIAELVKASEGGDMETIRPAINQVEKGCKSCHDLFRNQVAAD
jgi:cytochrome c556